MGFIRMMWSLFRHRKELIASIQEQVEAGARSLELTTQELAALSDDDLFFSAISRMDDVIDAHEELPEGFEALNEHQRLVYSLNYLEMEVNNGGLCQFFVNSSRVLAPYISGYMAEIGALEHQALFDGFIAKCGLDLSDLSSFVIRRARDFEKQVERFPFDEYDDRFYQLPSFQDSLTAYIRNHIDAF